MKNRRDFLKDVCPTVAFAFFGASFLEACASDDETATTGNTSKKYTVNLSDSTYNALNTVGGWVNGLSEGIPALLLRISETKINAYTNVCPHEGVNNRWSLVSGNTFRCGKHGNAYSTDCASSLTCYTTNQEGNILTITIP